MTAPVPPTFVVPAPAPALTDREVQVLRGMASGHSNGQIGRDLYLSEDTVKTHARRLFRKLHARDRAHAVALAFAAGVLVVDTDLGLIIGSRGASKQQPRTPTSSPAPPPAAPAATATPGQRGTVTLSCDDRDVALLAGAVYPREKTAPWAYARCRDALLKLTGTAT